MIQRVADDFEKTSRNLKVTLDIDEQLTWGELIRFVDLAKQSGVDNDAPVGLAHDDQRDDMTLTGIYQYLDTEDLPAGTQEP